MTAIADEQQTPASTRPSVREGVLIAVLGGIGFLAAFVLTNDKVKSLEAASAGDGFTASCDVNAFVACSGVFNTWQSEVFGFPNPLIGIAGFAVVAALGVLVAAKVDLPRFVWVGLLAGSVFGIAFTTWLQYQSIYSIVKLCPYCMIVWAVMIPLFVVVARITARRLAPGGGIASLLQNWTVLIVLLWYVAIAAAIWFQFGSDLWA